MKRFAIIASIVIFCNCSRSEPIYPRLIPQSAKVVVEANVNEMTESLAPILQMNFDSTAAIFKSPYDWDKNRSQKRLRWPPWKDTVVVPHGLKIIIDTSYNFHLKDFQVHERDFPNMDSLAKSGLSQDEIYKKYSDYYLNLEKDGGRFYESYPVLFYNESDTDMYIYTDENFVFIQEALDVDGNWKPIEYWSPTPSCIPTWRYLAISPKHYAASAIVKYHGNFKTKLRVRFQTDAGIYFSNAVTGYINRSQFDQSILRKHGWITQDDHITDKKLREEKLQYKLNGLTLR